MSTTISRKAFEMELRWIADQQKAYLEAQEEHRARGHRHPYCFHGTYQWVDYDPICGGCEEGRPDECTSLEDVRGHLNEWYGTDYDEDHLLWRFAPVAWGADQVEVVKIHRYETWGVKNKHNDFCEVQAVCTLALASDGTEFEMTLGTDEMIIVDPEDALEMDRAKEFNDEW